MHLSQLEESFPFNLDGFLEVPSVSLRKRLCPSGTIPNRDLLGHMSDCEKYPP